MVEQQQGESVSANDMKYGGLPISQWDASPGVCSEKSSLSYPKHPRETHLQRKTYKDLILMCH